MTDAQTTPDTSAEALTAIDRLYLQVDQGCNAPDAGDLWDEVTEIMNENEALAAENARLRDEVSQLKFAIAGGEDAPGLLDAVSSADLCEGLSKERSTSRDMMEFVAKRARDNALDAALAVKIPSAAWGQKTLPKEWDEAIRALKGDQS